MALAGSTPRCLSDFVVVGVGEPSYESLWVGLSSNSACVLVVVPLSGLSLR